MANEFVIKNGFISNGNSVITGNLTATQTISGTTAQFTNITASFSGTGASLTNITASAINDTTGSFSISNVQDGQFLKRSGNSIVGSFIMMAAFRESNQIINTKFLGATSSDEIQIVFPFSGTAVLA